MLDIFESLMTKVRDNADQMDKGHSPGYVLCLLFGIDSKSSHYNKLDYILKFHRRRQSKKKGTGRSYSSYDSTSTAVSDTKTRKVSGNQVDEASQEPGPVRDAQ